MSRVSLSISVADSALDVFDEIVERVARAGMNVKGRFPELGVLTGSIEESRVEDLKGIRGVAAVERERRYQLPPPESDEL